SVFSHRRLVHDLRKLRTTDERDKCISKCSAPAQSIVSADELLIMHLVPFREQDIAQGPRRLEDVATTTIAVQLEYSGFQIETHRKLWLGKELLREPINFGRSVHLVLGQVSQIVTQRAAVSTIVVGRPPERSGLADHVAKHL